MLTKKESDSKQVIKSKVVKFSEGRLMVEIPVRHRDKFEPGDVVRLGKFVSDQEWYQRMLDMVMLEDEYDYTLFSGYY